MDDGSPSSRARIPRDDDGRAAFVDTVRLQSFDVNGLVVSRPMSLVNKVRMNVFVKTLKTLTPSKLFSKSQGKVTCHRLILDDRSPNASADRVKGSLSTTPLPLLGTLEMTAIQRLEVLGCRRLTKIDSVSASMPHTRHGFVLVAS